LLRVKRDSALGNTKQQSMINKPTPASGEATNGGPLPFQRIFESQPGLLLILSPELIIQAATDAYLRETLTVREEIIGKHVLDVFPDNPGLPEASSTANLKASIQLALSSGKPHKMDVFQYDIPDPDKPGNFLERHWSTANTPVLNAHGGISCVIHETANVKESVKAGLQLKVSQKREQDALAQAEQQRLRLRRLFEQAPAAFALLEGPDLAFRELNGAYQQLFPGRRLLGLPVIEALPELKDQPVHDIMRNVYSTGETFEGKEILVPMARHQGQPLEDIYWSFIYQALFDAQGKISGLLIFALDVTESVEARRQIERSAEALQAMNRELEERVRSRTEELQRARGEAERQSRRLESLFMQAPAPICILEGPELVYGLVNPSYAQLFPGRRLLGKPILEALPEIKRNPVYRTFRNVYETGIAHEEAELLIPIARPGDEALQDRYFRYVQQARHDEQGKVDGVAVFALEVTEQVKGRKIAEESAEQFLFMANAMPQMVWTARADGAVAYCNQKWLDYTGLPADELMGWGWKGSIHPDDWEENAKEWRQSVATGGEFELEQRIRGKDGEYRWHLSRGVAHRDEQGAITKWVGTNTDIHDQKLTEQALQELTRELTGANASIHASNEHLGAANRQLTHINSDLDNFIYTASHDLKTPISNIERLLEVLLQELPEESRRLGEVKRITAMMQGAVDRFKRTIANLTEITKLQKDNIQEATPVILAAVVEEVRHDLGQMLTEHGARVETALEGCPPIPFSEKNLRSIVYNLLSNAAKYRHPGRAPLVRVGCREEAGYLVLTVQDNGLGMSPVQQGQLFTMFRRFHDHVDGSGIGLYMVKRIVDNAGGRIEVESKEGEGTVFSVHFRKE